jgi:hypothetical protein
MVVAGSFKRRRRRRRRKERKQICSSQKGRAHIYAQNIFFSFFLPVHHHSLICYSSLSIKMASKEEVASSSLSSSTHLITIPLPSTHNPTRLIAHLTKFQGPSFLLWCGACDEGWADMKAREEQAPQRQTTTSSLLVEEHHPPRMISGTPTGHLTTEWAVAMTNPRNKVNARTEPKSFSSESN